MRTFSLSLNRNDFHFLLWSCWAVNTSSLPGPRGSEATTWPARQCSSGTCWICPPLLGDPGAASGAWFLSNVKLLSALHSLKGYSCELEECVLFVTQASLLYLSPNMDVFLYFLLWKQYAVYEVAVDPHHIFHDLQVKAEKLHLEFLTL